MSRSDPIEIPEIRVRTPQASIEATSVPVEIVFTAPRGDRLARLWFEAYEAKREAESKLKRLRAEIERMLDAGEPVANTMGFLSWSESKVLRADLVGLFRQIGAKMFVQVSDVSSTRLRELIESGIIDRDAPCLRLDTVRRLVTRYR